jgi:CHAD domain-containing protein
VSYQIERGEDLGHGLARVASEQAAAAIQHLARAPRDPRAAIHEARKRSKEARAALRLLGAGDGGDLSRPARAAFRDASRLLAEPRDAEVALAALDGLRRRARLLRRDRVPAATALEARRRAAMRRMTRPAVAAVAASFAAAHAAVPAPGLISLDERALASQLGRIHRRGGRAMRRAYADGDGESFHRWRRQAKDLWYAARLLEPAWPGPLGALAAELHELSALLGDEHDLSILASALDGTQRGEPPLLAPRLARAIQRRQAALRDQARPLGQRLWAEPSRAFGGRLASYWAAWQPAGRTQPRG